MEKTIQKNKFFLDYLETKFDLLNLKDNEVFVWKVIRFKIYLKLNNYASNVSTKYNKKDFFNYIKKYSFRKIDYSRYEFSTLTLENPRKITYKADIIDPYTHFTSSEKKGVVGYTHFNFKVNEPEYQHKVDLNFIECEVLLSKLLRKRSIRLENEILYHNIEKEIFDFSKKNIDLTSIVRTSIQDFLIREKVYRKFFRKININQLKLICSYGKEPIISAAHKENIKVTEIQHGVMGPLHSGYSFNNEVVPYFPDEIEIFGSFWETITPLPKNTRTKIVGFPYLNETIESVNKQRNFNINKNIVVISQPTIVEELIDIMLDVVPKMRDFNFIFKLHPREYNNFEKQYPLIDKLNSYDNFCIVKNEKTVYELFSESKFVFGVYSTAIFEACAFDCFPVVFESKGYEYTDELRDFLKVKSVKTSNELIDYLLTNEENEISKNKISAIWYGIGLER